jgi:DNA-binding ferritin-like protein
MDAKTLQLESIELLNQALDDVVAVREHVMQARWIVLRGESLALPGLFERTGAHLQMLVDALAARVLDLGGTPLEGGHLVLRHPRFDTREAADQVPALVRQLALLLRYTRMRADVARSLGDAASAGLLAHARRGLEVLIWQVDRFAHAED